MKKISLPDWAIIISSAVGVGVTFVGFVSWLSHIDGRVVEQGHAQELERTDRKEDFIKIDSKMDRVLEELGQLRGEMRRWRDAPRR